MDTIRIYLPGQVEVEEFQGPLPARLILTALGLSGGYAIRRVGQQTKLIGNHIITPGEYDIVPPLNLMTRPTQVADTCVNAGELFEPPLVSGNTLLKRK